MYQANVARAVMKYCKVTPRTKYLGPYASFCQQNQGRSNAYLHDIKSSKTLGDMGTKPLSGSVIDLSRNGTNLVKK